MYQVGARRKPRYNRAAIMQERGKVSSICAECGAPVTFEVGAVQVSCSHCDAGLAVDRGTRLVRLGCPRCGGNFYYIDGSLCGHCPYCDASLLALAEDRVLRYVVRPEAEPPAEAEGARLLLLPFWHLGGLLYAWQLGKKVEYVEDRPSSSGEAQDTGDIVGKIRKDSGPQKVWAGRVLDQSLPDPATSAYGVTSLRTRAAVFPLEPFSREHEQLGQVVPACLDHRKSRGKLFAHAMRLAAAAEGLTQVDCQRFDLVSDALALYYYPFWVKNNDGGGYDVWDAVSGQPEQVSTPVDPPEASASGIFDELSLVELNCAACGGALPAGNHSTVIPCPGCGRFWQVTRQGLAPFEAFYARPRTAAQGTPVWLPFWRINVQVGYSGKRAACVADLTNVLGMLKVPGDKPRAAPDSPLCYYVPAFGAMKAPRVDHAARDLTRYQPAIEAGELGRGELYTCFLGEDDARKLAYATWILVVQVTAVSRIRSLRIETGAASLWYVPFDQDRGGRELINLLTGVSYDRVAFRGVRH
jgi:predicted RNA-binding Zn-ribbon protein involved in translation (DUF1610 family)